MDTYSFTPEFITRNGQAWFPIMGEIHYSRYPAEYWKESLLKMKAGGVDIVSAYVIWIHHEETEGEYDFTGNRDLRRFVRTCGECGLTLMLRIGPWSHGEVRNGGFPDWLLSKTFVPRTNDAGYLRAVEKFYQTVSAEVKGLLLKDGGPIIGVQIENEYGHCGGLAGEAGESHMRTLTCLAHDAGFDVPLYTATGWGGAVTGGLLPVMGGYCEAPWDQRLTDIEPSGNYIFTHERNDHNIGSDFGFGTGITFDMSKFPYLTAELGGGLQVTKHRRPIARAADIGAMSLAKLGSGVNLLGYYMYHGGTNPKGRKSTLHETKASGSINDLPELSYDFRAPIREYGQLSDTYRELKLLALFLHDFGSALCAMPADIPDDNPLFPADRKDLRYSYRCHGGSGYLFVNNYQRRQVQDSQRNVCPAIPKAAAVECGSAVIFPPFDIENGEYFYLPFNMRVGDALLETALVTPLCVLRKEKPVYVFYTAFAYAERMLIAGDTAGLYQFKDGIRPEGIDIVTLSRYEALNAWKAGEELIVNDNELLIEGDQIFVLSRDREIPVTVLPTDLNENVLSYRFEVPVWEGEDCFLSIEYIGTVARLYENDLLIADNFFLGTGRDLRWEIGLKRFGQGKAHFFRLEIEVLRADTPVFLETWPTLDQRDSRTLVSVSTERQIRTRMVP